MSRRRPFAMGRTLHTLRRLRRRSPAYRAVPEEYRAQVARWLLRMLVTQKKTEFEPELASCIAEVTGLGHLHIRKLDRPGAARACRFRLAELDQVPARREAPSLSQRGSDCSISRSLRNREGSAGLCGVGPRQFDLQGMCGVSGRGVNDRNL